MLRLVFVVLVAVFSWAAGIAYRDADAVDRRRDERRPPVLSDAEMRERQNHLHVMGLLFAFVVFLGSVAVFL